MARELRDALGDDPKLKLVLFFCEPRVASEALGRALGASFACPVLGCTSAGQIGPQGYVQGGLTAVGFLADDLTVRSAMLSNLRAQCEPEAARVVAELQPRHPSRSFALLFVDGLSRMEERLIAALYDGLGRIPIVGGSAGDDLRFEKTMVYFDGAFHVDSAVVAVLDSGVAFAPFKFQHFVPTRKRLVITRANPDERVVYEINGEPAAKAYAQLVGVDVAGLDAHVFAQNPVMLRLGNDYYVRSVQRRNPADDSLSFFCAIEMGLVLNIGKGVDVLSAAHSAFAEAHAHVKRPEVTIGCDCILRRLEFENAAIARDVGALMARNNVIGFSTYGEQFNGLHVNQTFAGVVLGSHS